MKKREAENNTEMRTGRIDAAMRRYDLGRDSMRKLAKAAGAEIRFGRSYLIDFQRVDEYLKTLSA